MSNSTDGFFRTGQIDGVWWLVDPLGKPFISQGINHVSWRGDLSPALGYSPYQRHAAAKHGTQEAWTAATLKRLRDWGFNTIGTWSDAELRGRGMPHVQILNIGIAAGGEWQHGIFPDVFSERFRAATEKAAAEQCAPHRDERDLLGYFTDNELRWGPDVRSTRTLLEGYWALPPDAPGKQELIRFLKQRYDTIAQFNRTWDAQFADFDALQQVSDPDAVSETFRRVRWESMLHTQLECCTPERILLYIRHWHKSVRELNAHWRTAFQSFEAALRPTELSAAGRERMALESGFLRLAAAAYFGHCARAIRRHDPNHLIMGCRFNGVAFPEVVQSMRDHVDLISYNNYSFQAPAERLRQIHAWGGRPMMLTEFSFKALDSGLPNTIGAGTAVQTQQERADLYEKYVTGLMDLPFMVGFHWFQYSDQPAEGRGDGENSNYGVVDLTDEPWEVLTSRMRAVNTSLSRRHALSRPG